MLNPCRVTAVATLAKIPVSDASPGVITTTPRPRAGATSFKKGMV
ncbi:hypothetical protein C5S42_02900 [Candidatus Methanomarinus sp.]|nr:hypothetical protein C5S42_02900 [ANME-2 cluster archaeon]